MSTTLLSDQIFQPRPTICFSCKTLNVRKPTRVPLPSSRKFKSLIESKQDLKWALRLSLVEQSPQKSSVDVESLVRFLYDDLPHLFDDQGIDRSAYDERVKFRDPITKHDTISGYLLNIDLLKMLFRPDFQLHWVKQAE